jgi:hypothetical protein
MEPVSNNKEKELDNLLIYHQNMSLNRKRNEVLSCKQTSSDITSYV